MSVPGTRRDTCFTHRQPLCLGVPGFFGYGLRAAKMGTSAVRNPHRGGGRLSLHGLEFCSQYSKWLKWTEKVPSDGPSACEGELQEVRGLVIS